MPQHRTPPLHASPPHASAGSGAAAGLTHRQPARRRSLQRLAGLYGAIVLGSALAQSVPDSPPAASSRIKDAVVRFVQQELTGTRPYTLHLPQQDPRGQLGPCEQLEVFLPAGQKLWGRGNVGVKCFAPSLWTIYVPFNVEVQGQYLVTARKLTPGKPIEADDLTFRQGVLSEMPVNVVTDSAAAIGRPARTALAAGQALRSEHFVPATVVRQGQSVKIVARGAGFSVSSEGKALANGSDGETVRVRNAAGLVLQGVARPGGIVEISY